MSGRRRLSRMPATRMPAARVVIVTEGARTEPEYFKTFVRIHSAPTVEIIPIGLGGDPRKVVDRAITELRNLRQDAHISRKDSVWAVFDRDEHPRFAEAKNLALAHGVGLAVSNPCFELWGVFHYRDLDAPMRRQNCQRLLSENCPSYSLHGGKLFNDAEVIEKNYPDAVERGRASLIRRTQEGDPKGNPSTSVHRLTEHIKCCSFVKLTV